MGLSIHYSGKLKDEVILKDLINEVKEIAEVYNWKYHLFDHRMPELTINSNDYNNELYGIAVTPENCESLNLTFLSNRRLAGPHQFMLFSKYSDKENKSYLYQLFTKTQYAGLPTHMLIIDLLQYISKKYFEDFELTDEGQYWETGDVALLADIFKRYENITDRMELAIQTIKPKDLESMTDYIERVAATVNKLEKKTGKDINPK
jgi:hypothetical protein